MADEQDGRLLELNWRPKGEPPSVVRIELRAEGARTVVVLEHTQIEATRGMRYVNSWTRSFDRFEAAR